MEDKGDCTVEDLGMFRTKRNIPEAVSKKSLSALEHQDIPTVWELLLLLNCLRTHPYCKVHDELDCRCWEGIYMEDT